MLRLFASILGMAIIGAVFAAVYFSPENVERHGTGSTTLGVGDVAFRDIEPSIAGEIIQVNLTFIGPPVDLYVMDAEWASSTTYGEGIGINLTRPFSYHAEWSRSNVTGNHNFSIIADGQTRLVMVFDHSDNYYDDTVPAADAGDVEVKVQTRYTAEESRSILLGYLAVTPSILLVVLTFGRQFQRWRLRRRRQQGME